MAKAKTNAPVEASKVTEASIEAESNRNVAVAEGERRALAQQFKKQETVPVSVPPLYKPYFGKVMTVTINGVSCAIPVNGKTYHIPESFAEEVKIRIHRQNKMFEKQRAMSEVQANIETSPGELSLF